MVFFVFFVFVVFFFFSYLLWYRSKMALQVSCWEWRPGWRNWVTAGVSCKTLFLLLAPYFSFCFLATMVAFHYHAVPPCCLCLGTGWPLANTTATVSQDTFLLSKLWMSAILSQHWKVTNIVSYNLLLKHRYFTYIYLDMYVSL